MVCKFYFRRKTWYCCFKERIAVEEYYDKNGKPKDEAIERLIADIDRGLWDSSFFWDIENYHTVTAASTLNSTMMNQLLCNNQNNVVQKKT